MRPELKEYNMDWLFAATFNVARNAGKASAKELRIMLEHAPYERGVLEPLLRLGKPSITFMELMGDYFTTLVTARETGKKVVMTSFCFDPILFHAFGNLAPVTLEVLTVLSSFLWKRSSYDFMDFCTEVGYSETGCSAQRGSMGAYLSGAGVPIDMVAVNMGGVCDTNSNSFSFASQYLNVPFYGLDYPAELATAEVTEYQRKDYRAMIAFLEEHGGARFEIDRLRELLEEKRKQDSLSDELEDLQLLVPNPMPGLYYVLIKAGRFTSSGKKIFTRMLEEMVEIVKDNAKNGRAGLTSEKEDFRAFMFYIDNFSLNMGMWDLFEKNNISHLGNMLTRTFQDTAPYSTGVPGTTYHIDTTDLDTMIDSMADFNSRMPMVKTIRGPYDGPNMWFEDSLAMARQYKADCCIYHGTPGCRNTWSNVKLIARDLEKHGFPTLVVNADSFDGRVESWETTSLRMEEFFKIRGLI